VLAPFLIMLREGLEAALVTGIIASYLKMTGRATLIPAVWLGILLAVALSLFAGAALQAVSAEFAQKTQELFEAVVGLIAITILVSMVFWMRKAARSIKTHLHDTVETALAAPRAASWALIGMVFFAVAREGLESVFFLLALFQQSSDPAAPLSALAGVLVAGALGYAIYVGGVRLNLARFFRWTGVFVIFVAAGLLSGVLRSLHEAGLWNIAQTRAFNLSGVLPVSSPLGTVLSGIFGYHDTPAIGEVIVYAVFLMIVVPLFLRPSGGQKPRFTAAATNHFQE
jgi:high-affinity iron transporter